MESHLYACILAGGSGERFWPMSRAETPKHLLKLLSDRTLVEETARRLEGIVAPGAIFVLTSEAQLSAVRAALPFVPPEQIIAEPARRDTGPAAALATALVRRRDPRGVLAILPADHCIRNQESFAAQVGRAFRLAATASSKPLVTFGIKPATPETGFGYLELGDPMGPEAEGFFRVRRFVEKPDAATARRYVEDGKHAWNAGIFIWSVDAFLAEASRQAPELAAFIRDFPAGNEAAYLADRFPRLPKISVDYAIMEKAETVAALLADFDWDDVGAWSAIPKYLGADAAGNAFRGPVVALDAANNIAISNGRVIALCGVKDLVIVETADAILVCHRAAVQDIKKLQPRLPKSVL